MSAAAQQTLNALWNALEQPDPWSILANLLYWTLLIVIGLAQFAVMFVNLGHACYERGSQLANRDRDAAGQSLSKAIQNLQTARQNMRFFPTLRYEEAVHDTYYYTALSYHKLYLVTKKASLLDSANNAWRDYFDFFPAKLEGNAAFEQSRQAARKYWDQIRDKL